MINVRRKTSGKSTPLVIDLLDHAKYVARHDHVVMFHPNGYLTNLCPRRQKMGRIHEREGMVDRAEMQLQEHLSRLQFNSDLTEGEFLRVVSGAFSNTLGGIAKYKIRMERHGDSNRPGGLAPEDVSEEG